MAETKEKPAKGEAKSDKAPKGGDQPKGKKDKGAEGTVLRVFPKTGRVTVEGVNKIKRHTRPTPTREGGIIEREAPIHHSNVMLLDGKGAPTRVRRRRDADGTVERIAVTTGQAIPRSR